MLDISVIIACFNGAATLPEALDSLVTQRWSRPWEIVFADNGSTDASVQIFEDYARRHPDLRMRVVDAGQRQGKNHALNVGIQAAEGRALLLCDADDTMAPGWLAAMGTALDRHAFVAARMDIRALNPDWTLAQRRLAQERELARCPTRRIAISAPPPRWGSAARSLMRLKASTPPSPSRGRRFRRPGRPRRLHACSSCPCGGQRPLAP